MTIAARYRLPGLIMRRIVHGRHNLQQIAVNSAWLYSDRAIRLLGGLLITPWLARYLGPEQFGVLNYATALVVLFSAFATLGLDSFLVRGFIDSPAARGSYFGTAFILKLFGAGLVVLLASVAALTLHSDDMRLMTLVVIIATGSIFQSTDVIAFWNQSQMQQKLTVVAKNGAFVLLSITKIFLIVLQAPLEAFAVAASAEVMVGSIALFLLYRHKQGRPIDWKFDRAVAINLLKVSWPLIFSSMAISVYMRIDQIMLGKMVNDHEVGIYSAALRLSELWYVLPTVVVSAALPILLRTKQESEERFMAMLQKLFSILVKVAYVVAIPMTFFAGDVIGLFFGPEYRAAGPVLMIHVWSSIFVFFGVVASAWIAAFGYTKFALMQTLVGVVANISLNLVLIPDYGAVGAAWATVISYGIASYVSNLFWAPARPIFRLQTKSFIA